VVLLRKYDYLRATNMVTLSYAQTMLTALCFVVYVYEGNTLTVPTTFAFLALANACRQPFSIFSNAVVYTSEGWASMQRISQFLGAEEVKMDLSHASLKPLAAGEPMIEINEADFTWNARSVAESDAQVPRPILRNISFRAMPGSLTIVVGLLAVASRV
jgi:ABC-type multidrug transport system fused ATPase/permease subunit